MIMKRGLSNYYFYFYGCFASYVNFLAFSAPSSCLPIKFAFFLRKDNGKGEKFFLFEPILKGSDGRPLSLGTDG